MALQTAAFKNFEMKTSRLNAYIKVQKDKQCNKTKTKNKNEVFC